MSNPPKKQGTAWETTVVRAAQAAGYKAWRLAEAGSNDPGDVAIETPDGDVYVLECKNRSNLNVHDAGDKHSAKVAAADLPFLVAGTGVAWKRLLRKGENARRSDAGAPGVWVSLDEWLELIGR